MFKHLLNKKKTEVLLAPISGQLKNLGDVPDPVFSEKLMGDGVAIIPTFGEVVAPCDGRVETVFPTKHAIGLTSDGGAEILIHIGLETVTMKGNGFTPHVEAGEKIKRGQRLISFDLEKVKKEAVDCITPMIITGGKANITSFNAGQNTTVVSNETEIISLST